MDNSRSMDGPRYEDDFFAWTQDQAAKLRARAHNEIDWENAAEELESVGTSERGEIRSRLGQLVLHLLKWEHQPERRGHSWQSSISEQRVHIQGKIEDSPSLKSHPAASLEWAWNWARRRAARETGLPLETFPETPSYSVEDILSDDFMPGKPWKPEELSRD
ncbi:MAG: DUF29 domain-containing protein [Ahrensia sp.]|nr:DUF29 domain-containing protein [Ahrensia sp.]